MTESLFGDDRVDVLVRALHKIPGWAPDHEADRQWAGLLLQQYPTLNLVELIPGYVGHEIDRTKRKKVNHRARFANWCSIEARGRRNGRAHRPAARAERPGGGGSRSGGAPAAADVFTGSGYRSW